jgi:hypothetical protein
MEDWEENLYDYGATGGDDYGDAGDDDTFGRIRDEDFGMDGDGDDDDPFRGDFTRDDEDVDFKPDFKQMQQMIGDKGRGTTLAPGASKRAQKAMRSAEDVINDQLRGVLSSDVYSNLSENKKGTIVAEAEVLKNIALLHLETLVQALLWKIENAVLNKKSFNDFVKKYGVTDPISFLTYIRLVTLAK